METDPVRLLTDDAGTRLCSREEKAEKLHGASTAQIWGRLFVGSPCRWRTYKSAFKVLKHVGLLVFDLLVTDQFTGRGGNRCANGEENVSGFLGVNLSLLAQDPQWLRCPRPCSALADVCALPNAERCAVGRQFDEASLPMKGFGRWDDLISCLSFSAE